MLYRRVVEHLREEKGKIENYIIQGQIHDFASYKFFVGQIKGLQDAIDICKNTFKEDIDDTGRSGN